MRIFYDTEFLENGRTIDLISIGMVAEDGREYYAVSSEFDFKALAANPWLLANVWRSLPQIHGDQRMYALAGATWPKWLPRTKGMRLRAKARQLRRLFDWAHPAVKPRRTIAAEVHAFLVPSLINFDPEARCELWAWYAAYDHVALAQLFGPMINMPPGIPMFTNDLKQECVRLGDPQMREQEAGQHNALEDARHNRDIAYALDALARADVTVVPAGCARCGDPHHRLDNCPDYDPDDDYHGSYE